MSFALPGTVSALCAPGPIPGIIGASVDDQGIAHVIGKSRDWVIAQAGATWAKLGCYPQARVDAVLKRADEMTPSGPIKGSTTICTVEFVDSGIAVVTSGRTMRSVQAQSI